MTNLPQVVLRLTMFLTMTWLSPLVAAPTIGKAAPDFSLIGHTGVTYRLSDQKGKIVVLEWFNKNCPYTAKHYSKKVRNIQSLQQKWSKIGMTQGPKLVWFTISSAAEGIDGYLTPTTALSTLQERESLARAILLDHDGTVGKLYGAINTPQFFIIDATGTLRYQGAIDSISSTRASDIKKPHNIHYVNDALEAIYSGKTVIHSATRPYGCRIKYTDTEANEKP